MIGITIYFDLDNNEDEKKLYEKLRELTFLRRIPSMSAHMKACTYAALFKDKQIN